MSTELLNEMLKENARLAEQEKQVEVTVCPVCLWPMLKANKLGEKHCYICGWTG